MNEQVDIMNEQVDIFAQLDKLKVHLRQLTTSQLSELIPGVGDFLDSMGTPILPKTLADAIVDIKQTSIFEDRDIRNALFDIFDIPTVNTWSNNSICRKILRDLDLAEAFLPQERSSRNLNKISEPGATLHDYQEWLKRKVTKMILGQKERKLMIQMPTGSGKTWTMMESIYDFIRVSDEPIPGVIWLAHTDELCEQAIQSFDLGWQNRGSSKVELLRLWGGNAAKIDVLPDTTFFAVMSFQSAYSMSMTNKDKIFELFFKLKNRSSLLIIDEAHQALAKTYRSNIELLSKQDTKVIGLTATPGRHGIGQTNAESLKLAKFFDNNIQNIDEFCLQKENKTPLIYLQDKGILSRVKYAPLKTDYKFQLNENEKEILARTLELPHSVLKEAAQDVQRNSLIIANIIHLVEQHNKKVLVFSPSKDNSDFLSTLLNLRNIKAKSVTAETSFTDRQSSVEAFKKRNIDVLLNYGVFTTGFDDPTIDCVLIARPTASVVLYSQMVGRGLRGLKMNGTEECLLVDVVDNLENQPNLNLANSYFEDSWHQ